MLAGESKCVDGPGFWAPLVYTHDDACVGGMIYFTNETMRSSVVECQWKPMTRYTDYCPFASYRTKASHGRQFRLSCGGGAFRVHDIDNVAAADYITLVCHAVPGIGTITICAVTQAGGRLTAKRA